MSLLSFFRGEGGADSKQEHQKIRTDCEASPACAPLEHHFEKCQEKVNAGEGYKGEDCVDEMCVFSPFLLFFLPRRLID
jgi:hypothetical protein